ncbi:MAG: HAD family hydrolase [Patescibacteria group bacterium]
MIKAVLFDVDGVLLDSEESNREFFRRVLGKFGYKAPTKKEYRKAFHLNLRDAIIALTNEEDEVKIQKIWDYGATLPDYPDDLLKIPEGMPEVIKKLNREYKLGIVTSRIKAGVEEFFNFTGFRKYFDIAIFFGEYSRSKPDPECLLVAVSRLSIKPEEAVYVGDAQTDMIAARDAGVHFILFPENPQIKTKFVVKEFKDIPKIIEDYF